MTPASISGTTPGVLDTTQPLRLLRRPSSTLSFASFDPRVASADHGWDLRSLSLNEELYRPKRVVIETTCSGESSWRFVPKARCEDGVLNEGSWPRVVDLCGQLVECDQDQWDIYKLDPADHRRRAEAHGGRQAAAGEAPHVLGGTVSGNATLQLAKTFRLDSDDSEEDEVADMVVDDGAMPRMRRMPSAAGDRAKKFREETEKNRKERREKVAARSERLAFREDAFFNFAAQPIQPQHTGSPTLDTGPKRKVASLFDSLPLRAGLASVRSSPVGVRALSGRVGTPSAALLFSFSVFAAGRKERETYVRGRACAFGGLSRSLNEGL
ncbi:hypothetical protein B0H14DRAFT_3449835 [Mycena olivaceomarginata]|nr:hypothetical protein B0H14DRAFT_3449835 [Mycena olivaceomarginata]